MEVWEKAPNYLKFCFKDLSKIINSPDNDIMQNKRIHKTIEWKSAVCLERHQTFLTVHPTVASWKKKLIIGMNWFVTVTPVLKISIAAVAALSGIIHLLRFIKVARSMQAKITIG